MRRPAISPSAVPPARDGGFTLLELLITISLAGIIMATATWTFVSWQRAHEQRSTALELTSTLRNAAERALSEGRTYCVRLNTATGTFDTYRSSCTGTRVNSAKTDSSRVTLVTPSFAAPATPIANQTTSCPTAGSCAYFYPRGNALAGTVGVARSGSAKLFTVKVEGLTSRVSQS